MKNNTALGKRIGQPRSMGLLLRQRQKGVATILIVLLVGASVIAIAAGLFHSTRSAQEKQVATHAQTHAQNSLWFGLEAFRRYLGTLDAEGLDALNNTAQLDISVDSHYGTIEAQNITVTTVGSLTQITANILAKHTHAKAATGMQVTFSIDPSACTNCVQLSAALNFQDDLRGTNDINFDMPVTINVDGDIDFSSIDVTPLNALNATGSVTLNTASTAAINTIHANGDVDISNTTVTSIQSKGDVTINSDAAVDTIRADGDINLLAESDTMSVRSRADIVVGHASGNHTLLNAGGTVELQTGTDGYDGIVNTLTSVGNVTIASGGAQVNTLQSEGDLGCPGAGWTGYSDVAINGTLSANCTEIAADLLAQDPLAANNPIQIPGGVSIGVMIPVSPFALPPQPVDVWELIDDANYIFEPVGAQVRVTVNNINGSVTGTQYILGKSASNGTSLYDVLCEAVDGNQRCVCPTPGCTLVDKHVCLGYAPNEGCIGYNSGTFTLAGTGIAPGIWFIDGNVEVSNGFNNATMLVSGNIHSSNHYRGSAVNYGGEPPNYDIGDRTETVKANRTSPYDEICLAIGTGLQEASSHMISAYTSRFVNRYPTNLCDKSTSTYFPIATGNIALAAGGTKPVSKGGDGTTYSGGDISIGANTQVYGITLAGGYFESRDNAAYFGYIVAAALAGERADGVEKNLLSGNTRVILDTETELYKPDEIPKMGETPPCVSGCSGASEVGPKLLWSKYL